MHAEPVLVKGSCRRSLTLRGTEAYERPTLVTDLIGFDTTRTISGVGLPRQLNRKRPAVRTFATLLGSKQARYVPRGRRALGYMMPVAPLSNSFSASVCDAT